MDLATIAGSLSGVILIIWAITQKSALSAFWDLPSVAIVLGGATAATLINFQLSHFLGVMGVVKNAFKQKNLNEVGMITTIVDLAIKARKDGILAIDKALGDVEDDFLRTGLELAVDGTEPETIRVVLETELSYMMARHERGKNIFDSLGLYSPAFGMIGTLIGLVGMLRSLDDPSTIGPAMAIALITTFYGSLLANLVFLPIAGKLQQRSEAEITLKELVIEGVLTIQMGEHPKTIHRKLMNFIPPSKRVEEK